MPARRRDAAEVARRRLERLVGEVGGWVPTAPGGPADGDVPVPPPPRWRASWVSATAVGPRALAGLLVLVLPLLALGGWRWWQSRPDVLTSPAAVPTLQRELPPGPTDRTAGPPSGEARASAAAAGVVVHVAGLVRRPGVVRLSAGSRVQDAVTAAGGPAPGADLGSVNLARLLVDGEQVVVGRVGAPAASGGASGAGAGAGPGASGPVGAGAVLDLNAAGVEQLQELPGVGPVLARRIVDWRSEHGRFTTVDELREVSGIGERKFADIAPRVRV